MTSQAIGLEGTRLAHPLGESFVAELRLNRVTELDEFRPARRRDFHRGARQSNVTDLLPRLRWTVEASADRDAKTPG